MRILLVIDTMLLGGAQRMFAFLANQLSKRGYDVVLLSYASETTTYPLDPDVEYIPGEDYEGNGIIKHIKKIPYVTASIKKYKPEIIISFAQIPAIISIMATVGKNIPVVFCERGDPYQYSSVVQKAKIWLVNAANFFVFQTKAARDYYPNRTRKNSVVIPNPVTCKRPEIVPYSSRKNEIAFVGRFDLHQKRHDLMISAFKSIAEKYPDITLHFYGDGPDMNYIRELVKQENLCDSVVFEGKVDDVIEEIRYSKLFVITSDYEGIPNALIEAMCAGLPCVATDCSPGGASMLINDKENGLLVPCGDVKEIVRAIEYMLDNPENAQSMGYKAQEIVDKYNPTSIIDQWDNMISLVTGK